MKDVRRKALQVALYTTWIAGLLCIVVSLYATQLLPSLPGQQRVEAKDAMALKVTLFAIPEPFEGTVGAAQARAIYSWLRLSLDIQVVLLGKHKSLWHFAEKMHHRIIVDSDIDFTFSGAALFSSIMARACSSTSDISVLVDPQFLLMEEFVDTLRHAHSLEHSWLLVAAAKNLHVLPFDLNFYEGFWVNGDRQPVRDEQVHAYAKTHGVWRSCTGRYLWAWSTENVPLHAGVMPSFVYGYDFHHEWLLNEALSSGIRFVFDASDAITAFYSGRIESSYFLPDGAVNSRKGSWEADNNAHLAALYGSFYFRPSDFVNTPAKLIMCGSPNFKFFQFVYPSFGTRLSVDEGIPTFLSRHNYVEMQDVLGSSHLWNKSFLTSFQRFGRQTSTVRYPCPPAADVIVRKTPGRTSVKTKLMIGKLRVGCDCSNITRETLDCPSSKMRRLPTLLASRSSMRLTSESSMSMSLDSLLTKVSSINRTVVLSVVGNNYRDMLMNWVCRLRKLRIHSFIIGAVDTQLYEFGLLQGLPVFMSGPGLELSFNDCHFGTECFKKVTKMKSRTVLQILKLGYRVLFSDVDVYWFKNPIEYLMSFGARTVVAQSDEWNITEAPNRPRRLNSGFYFAWPDSSTIAAFELIVKHASFSNMSEQPSFYDVLCGELGRHRVGDSHCLEPQIDVTTHFLDRALFPNGAFNDLWDQENVSEACRLQGCLVLHNNWISGRHRKFARQIASGLWDYDVKNRICVWGWQDRTS